MKNKVGGYAEQNGIHFAINPHTVALNDFDALLPVFSLRPDEGLYVIKFDDEYVNHDPIEHHNAYSNLNRLR